MSNRECIKELAKKCNCSISIIYRYIKRNKLNRLPTEDEINNRNTLKGRPRKYK